MPRSATSKSGGEQLPTPVERTARDEPLLRSAAESLAQNIVSHSENCAERETLVEGLRCQPNVTEAPLRAAVFLRTDKRGRGQLLALPRAITRLGRSWEADARVEDDAVSRFHAEVRVDQGRFFITDLNSANGTFVNDERIVDAALPTLVVDRACNDLGAPASAAGRSANPVCHG